MSATEAVSARDAEARVARILIQARGALQRAQEGLDSFSSGCAPAYSGADGLFRDAGPFRGAGGLFWDADLFWAAVGLFWDGAGLFWGAECRAPARSRGEPCAGQL
jgi:hypothetical protein